MRPEAKTKGTRPVGAGCGEAEQGGPRQTETQVLPGPLSP